MKKISLNKNWQFWKEGNEETRITINVPHDAMLTEERNPKLPGGSASGFYPGGKYYYRKELYFGEEYQGKTVLIEFEGIYMNSTIYLNGNKIGGHIYGYTNFYVDLTQQIQIGKSNELLVIADNSLTPNSRWYSGSGIYRPVTMLVGEEEYLLPQGIQLTTESIHPAVIHAKVEAIKKKESDIIIKIYDAGNLVGEIHGENGTCKIENPCLWSAEHPYLYQVQVELWNHSRLVDTETISYGIREITWSHTAGFAVNGETVKLKGGCVHHDNGPLGAATNDSAEYRKIQKMKELGFNAVRYSHNPAGKNFLRLCDELGMYVLDETFDQWKIPQSTYDYATCFDEEWEKDLTALISKDYNHPSVIMYCIGNEITDTGLPHGAAICKMLCNKVKELDATRPTTIAINSMLSVLAHMQAQKAQDDKEGKEEVGSKEVNDIITLLPKLMASITAESLEELIHDVVEEVDIVGYNYGENLYPGIHNLAPQRVILSSETFPAQIGAHWPSIEQEPYLIGDFMWTAWDYLGEAGVGLPFYGTETAPFSKDYPCLTAGCGCIDLTGYVESQGKYASVVFGSERKPCIAVRPLNHAGELYTVGKWRLTDAIDSWSWPGYAGQIAEVQVYSQGTQVELFLNNKSLGKQPLTECRAFYEVAYEPGELRAISYDKEGQMIGESQMESAEEQQYQLTVEPEHTTISADGTELSYVNISITDGKGNVHVLSDRSLQVAVEGQGHLVALASGNPETTESFHDMSYTTYHGRLLAIVQSGEEPGELTVSVSGEGLESVSKTIIVQKEEEVKNE